jgi:hypothetical protein
MKRGPAAVPRTTYHLANVLSIISLFAIINLAAVAAHGGESMSCDMLRNSPLWGYTGLPTQLGRVGYSHMNDQYNLTDIQTLSRDPVTGDLTCTATIHLAGNRWSFTNWLPPYEGQVTFQVKVSAAPNRLPPNVAPPPPVTLTRGTPFTLQFLPTVTPPPTVSETAPDGSRRVVH